MDGLRTSSVVMIILMLGMLACGCTYENVAKKIDIERTLNAEGIQQITIDVKLANISIRASHQNQIRAKVTGNVSKNHLIRFQAKAQGNSATIQFSQDQKHPVSYQFTEPIPQLTIDLPERLYQMMTLKTTFGNLKANDKLLVKKIHINAEDGDIVLNGYQGEKIQGTIKFGNLTLQQLDASVDLQTDEGDANIFLSHSLKGQNQFKTQFGDVKITFPKVPESLRLNLNTELGKIKSNFFNVQLQNSDQHQIFKGMIGKPTNNSPTLSITSESGDISLIN